MRLFVTGGAGQVGGELAKFKAYRDLDVITTTHQTLDITDYTAVYQTIKQADPDLVVNSAAYTAVDRAEDERKKAFATNRDGPCIIAKICRDLDLPLIHISTDYVFDGDKKEPYLEIDPVCPIGIYGKSKEAGERAVRKNHAKHIIFRTSWVYAAHGTNFVKTMLKLATERDLIRVVDDQLGAPTAAGDIAKAIVHIAEKIHKDELITEWGTYHFAAIGETTWCDFAKEIFSLAGSRLSYLPKVEGISTADYPTIAKRPLNSLLDCSLVEEKFRVPRRNWNEGLAEVLEKLLQPQSSKTD